MARVFITYTIPEAGPNLLREAGHEVVMREDEELIPHEELITALQEYDAVLPLLTERLDKETIDQAGDQLKVIANYAVGYDNIDAEAAKEKGIVVTNTPDVLTTAVAEHTIILLGSIARRVVEADTFTREGNYTGWRPMMLLGMELQGKTLGVVGTGRIGAEVAKRAHAGFGMNIAYNDLKPNEEFEKETEATFYENLDEMLPEIDAVTTHVPLLDATRHLINGERMLKMKKTAYVVNTSRGPVVDEEALVEALKAHDIAGAAIDVFEEEPDLKPGATELDNLIVTPHIASATIEARSAMAELAARNIINVLAGEEPETPVN